MLYRRVALEQIAPWLVSGASGFYIVARARRLSRARASRAPLADFLVAQSDMILLLFGSPAVWHFTRQMWQNKRRNGRTPNSAPRQMPPGPFHQLREVFTALLIGTGLIIRKASAGKTGEVVEVAMRLHKVVHDGIDALATVEDRRLGDLLDGALAYNMFMEHNGRWP